MHEKIKMSEAVSSLVDRIVSKNKLQKNMILTGLKSLSGDNLCDFEAYINFCSKKGMNHKYLSDCYELITRASFREQVYFKRHKKYRYSSYSEVSNSVYFNEDYMLRYMTGLALTSFLWPNHVAMMNYFHENLPRDKAGLYLEIGPGHGFYMMNAMRLTSFSHFLAVDISPTSVNMTKSILSDSSFGKFDRYEIIQGDFLEFPSTDKFDVIVMGEVLEHVESPVSFLKKAHCCCKENGFIYITTAINAPAVDHIYLYRSSEQIETQVKSCGFEVLNKLVCPYYGTSLEESIQNDLPVNIALVLQKSN